VRGHVFSLDGLELAKGSCLVEGTIWVRGALPEHWVEQSEKEGILLGKRD